MGHCKDCSGVLDMDSAFYHLSGVGPMCLTCINNDEEINGLKWINLVEF